MSEDKDKDKKAGSVAEAIQSKFIEDRKVFLWGEVSDKSARDITEKLLHLEAINPGEEITFYINSPGCLLYTSPSPRDATLSRMPSSA